MVQLVNNLPIFRIYLIDLETNFNASFEWKKGQFNDEGTSFS